MVVQQTFRGEQVLNIVHYNSATLAPWSAADLFDLANAIKTAWKVTTGTIGIAGNITQDVTIQRVVATDLSEEDGVQEVSNVADGPAGGTAAALENGIALCASLRTGFSGRSFRGRLYVPGISSSNGGSDPNHVGGTYATNMQTAVTNTFQGTGVRAGWGVLSRVHNGLLRENAICTPITSVVVNTRLDSQRRRMPRF